MLDTGLRRASHAVTPAEEFTRAWVPYVAHLYARTPRISDFVVSDLRTAPRTTATPWIERASLFGRFADTLIHDTAWTIIETNKEPFIQSDAGFVCLLGEGEGSVVMPLTPRHAVHLAPGTSMVPSGGTKVRIPRVAWHPDDTAVLNDLLAISAGREVYASQTQQIDHARALRDGTAQPRPNRNGVDAGLVATTATEMVSYILAPHRAVDPWVTYSVAAHEFGCNCGSPKALGLCTADIPAPTIKRINRDRSRTRVESGPTVGGWMVERDLVAFGDVNGFHVQHITEGQVIKVFRREGAPFTTSG